MEAGNPAPAGGSTLPRSSLATRSRKPRIRRVSPDQGNRWIGWKEEAPHLQGFTVPAGKAFFSFPVDGLHRFSPVPADEAQPSVGSPTRKDSPLIEQEKNVSKSEAPHPQRFTPIVVARHRFIVEARTRRDSSSVSRGNLLKRQEAPHPQGFLPPPVPPAAGGGKLHARRGSPWMRLLSGAKRGEPRPAGDSPTASPRSLKGVPEAPHPRDSPHLFLQAPRIKLPEIPYPRYSRQLGNPASPSLRGKSRARRVPLFSGKGAGLFSVKQQGRTGNSPCRGKGLMPSSLNPRE